MTEGTNMGTDPLRKNQAARYHSSSIRASLLRFTRKRSRQQYVPWALIKYGTDSTHGILS